MPSNNASPNASGQGKGGKNKRRASLTATFDDTLLSASATHPVTGGADDLLADATSVGRGGLLVVAALDAALDDVGFSAAADPIPAGALTSTLDDAGVSGAMIHLSELVLVSALDATTLAVAGGPVVSAALTSTLRSGSLSAFGVMSPSELVLNATLDDASFDAEGALPIAASAAVQLGPVVLVAHSPFAERTAQLDVALSGVVLSVGGGPVASAALVATFADASATSGARGTAGATVRLTLDDVGVDAEAAELAAASAAIVLENARSAATGTLDIAAQLIAQLADSKTLPAPEPGTERGDFITQAERVDMYSHRRADEEAFA